MDGVDLSYDVGFDVPPPDLDESEFPIGDAHLLPPESSPNASPNVDEDSGTQAQKRYLSKRPHRKSRAGCKQCKKRKVKCDEARPTCKACTLRQEPCVYPNITLGLPGPTAAAKSLPAYATGSLPVRSRGRLVKLVDGDDSQLARDVISVVSEPLFIPEQVADITDMKMLWFYSTYSFRAFSVAPEHSPALTHVLKVKVVEHAFRAPFLMEAVKALSALHLRNLGQPVPNHKVIGYQARTFQGYRNAIKAANPADYPAILGCSLFTVAISSQTFRDPNSKRLFIVDWIAMWRGIGLVVDMISRKAVSESGLALIFDRPPIYMGEVTQYIPNALLFMVSSIKHEDADYEHQADYYELLKYIGSLFMELTDNGLGPVLSFRIITNFSFCPLPLLPLAKQLRPRMLIIIAYWLCFVKLIYPNTWWMQGITPQAYQIFEELGEEWAHLLHVPRMAMETDDRVEIARLLIGNENWSSSELGLYKTHTDLKGKRDYTLSMNEGIEAETAEDYSQRKADRVRDVSQVIDLDAESVDPSEGLLVGTNLVYKFIPRTTPTPSLATSSSQSSTPGLPLSKSPHNPPLP